MKSLILTFFSLLVTLSLVAQQPYYSAKRITDAKQLAGERDVPIVLVFSGSDWCRPCIQFKDQVLDNTTYQEYAADNFVELYLDFPMLKKNKLEPSQRKHNDALAKRFNKQGAFPKIVVLSADEEVIGTLWYRRQNAQDFVAELVKVLGTE